MKLKGKRIYIVEDNPDNILIIQMILSKHGASVTVDWWASGKNERILAAMPLDLIILDLMMPEMNGFEVLQFLRSKKVEVPIIVFSALSHKETVVKAVGFGVHSYLIKPLKPEQVMQKAVEILGRNF